MFLTGFCCAIVFDFLFSLITDRICKRAGDVCGYDCEKCKSHCVGYYCNMRRIADANIKGGNDGEISDERSADSN